MEEDETIMRITIRLRNLREFKKQSQGQLAMRIGLHRSYIAKIEQGHRVPTIDVLYRLAHYFGCRMEDLISLESDRGKNK
jgi:transcriptional regulator with XRE-family HTH domain